MTLGRLKISAMDTRVNLSLNQVLYWTSQSLIPFRVANIPFELLHNYMKGLTSLYCSWESPAR